MFAIFVILCLGLDILQVSFMDTVSKLKFLSNSLAVTFNLLWWPFLFAGCQFTQDFYGLTFVLWF